MDIGDRVANSTSSVKVLVGVETAAAGDETRTVGREHSLTTVAHSSNVPIVTKLATAETITMSCRRKY